MSTPIPAGRGRWRVTLHNRIYTSLGMTVSGTEVAELPDARSRQLVKAWNQSSQFSFALDGHSESARLIQELAMDVYAWRWDEASGADVPMFRGLIAQSQDTISEQVHTVTFTAHDYISMLDRRFLWAPVNYAAADQDGLTADLVNRATRVQSGSGTVFTPSAFLPLGYAQVAPDGSNRGPSGQLRDRQYAAGAAIGPLVADLAAVIGGFDFDVRVNSPNATDVLRAFYPNQGITRTEPLMFGASVANLTRNLNSADYANYWRVIGGSGSSDATAPPLYAEAWNADANNVAQSPQGLWQSLDNQADVTVQATLLEKAQGNLLYSGLIVPSYTLGLRPDWYTYGVVNMGDTVPLVVKSGRLNINTLVRIVGITYDIGDDGEEDVSLTVGRPAATLLDLLQGNDRTVQALVRR